MKVWRRWLLRFGAWACTALVVLSALAAVLSNRYWFVWSGENYRRSALSSRGVVSFHADLRRLPPGIIVIMSDGPGPGWHYGTYEDNGNYFNSHRVPPWQWKASASFRGNDVSLEVPLWIPMAAATLAAVPLWWSDVRVCRRRRAGLCLSCGYDRLGLAGTAPCPECGTKPSSPFLALM